MATPDRPQGLRGPAWAWYAAGFVALGCLATPVYLLKHPPARGLEPELLVQLAPQTHTGHPQSPAPSELDLSASIRRRGLDLRAGRLPSDIFTTVALLDARGQLWLVQRGDRQDGSCLPSCDALKLRVDLDQLAPGPFRVAVVTAPTPITLAAFQDWLRRSGEQPPIWLGARAYAVETIER